MSDASTIRGHGVSATAWTVLIAISLCHMINDIMQSMLAAIYPLLQQEFTLSYWQIGLMTFAFQVTASLLQPVVGAVTDKKPMPRSLAVGMGATVCGVLLLALAHEYWVLLAGAMLIGVGSAVFHPESSRVARIASGGRFGTAQSLFQLGGNFGQALGPLLAAFIVVPLGRPSVAVFSVAAMLGSAMLWRVGTWAEGRRKAAGARVVGPSPLAPRRVAMAIVVLALLTFTKNIYTASLSSYYTFFLIEKFGLSTQQAQIMLFLFLGGMAAGVMLGGLLGDRVGPLKVIWFSILGILPFTLALPHVGLAATGVLTVIIGLILASAFPAIVVFAQELVPGRTGMIAGIFFGFAFGMGGIAAAVLGLVADARGIEFVYKICSYLPLMGLLTVFLPRMERL
ncbi:MFS transporter, FSR family, fosmidomycin resistance protein [Paracoccus aminovorans]|uniref:MFS transporter, FSR family, fosmidomycin resistance protein n=1 Tax=Paracoccus aminovorans TaxID=34004 RepID=A0A1I3CIU9_9RHOB|nr:MFS transporter [Paracoccus aminovorans]CQR87134.1 fosmidomycin resistance protein [Paracoccus aminovorans]SFH74263.1 MFS transporter, FSR family, fosmidomycin resistance protein [Paracoccus aminovorans]